MNTPIDILKISLFGSANKDTSQHLLAFEVMKEHENLGVCLPLAQKTIEKLIVDYFNTEFSYDIEDISEIEGSEEFVDSVTDKLHDKIMGWWSVKDSVTETVKKPLKYGGRELHCYLFILKDKLSHS